jgi:hypothetical protein
VGLHSFQNHPKTKHQKKSGKLAKKDLDVDFFIYLSARFCQQAPTAKLVSLSALLPNSFIDFHAARCAAFVEN